VRHVGVVAAHLGSLTLLLVGTSASAGAVAAKLVAAGFPPWSAPLALPAAALVVAVPVAAGAWWSMTRLADHLAAEVVPAGAVGTDAARGLVQASVRLLVLLGSVVPAIAISRPFLGAWAGGTVVPLLVVAGAAALVWRRAGEVVPESLSAADELSKLLGPDAPEHAPPGAATGAASTAPPSPGMVGVRLLAGAPAVGRTLAELDLRAVTGASVVAVGRAGAAVISPTGHERLCADDLLGLVGAPEALERARAHLLGPAR
jgi:CPA2 family monovalent cation:H+ antiporter-2